MIYHATIHDHAFLENKFREDMRMSKDVEHCNAHKFNCRLHKSCEGKKKPALTARDQLIPLDNARQQSANSFKMSQCYKRNDRVYARTDVATLTIDDPSLPNTAKTEAHIFQRRAQQKQN
jgi:hypothetical protein